MKKTPGVHSSVGIVFVWLMMYAILRVVHFASPKDIIKMQIDQNANYEMRTEYSKDKYKKRKEAKSVRPSSFSSCSATRINPLILPTLMVHRFLQGFSVLQPTMFNICEYQFSRDPQRIKGIRADTLAQMMSFGNIRPGAKVVVVDETGGLLVAAVLDRLGGA